MSKTFSLLVYFCLGHGIAKAESTVPLFVIERSTNSNLVHYDAQLGSNGKLDSKTPIVTYWEMKAKDGRKQELTSLEKRRAYGFKLDQNKSESEIYVIHLVPQKNRPIKIYLKETKPIAEVLINHIPSQLTKIYIQTRGQGLIPPIRFIDLHGIDLKTGEPTFEKVLP